MSNADMGVIVLTLRATRPLTIRRHMGRAVQQFCLDVIRQSDSQLSGQFHTEDHSARPYAVSGLLRPNAVAPVWGNISPGEEAWVRLVGLQSEVVAALDAFAASPPDRIEIDHAPWAVTDVAQGERTTYPALLRAHQQATSLSTVVLAFETPTSFHSAGNNVPLPLPMLVFNSLMMRWNNFSGFALPQELPGFVEYFVVLTRHCIESHSLIFKKGHPEIGFTGEATFRIVPRNSHLDKLAENHHDMAELRDRLMSRHADLSRPVGLLTDFAVYSGVGIKTAQGMGIVRRVS